MAALYLSTAVPVSRHAVHWALNRSLEARHLLLSVGHAQALHPGKIILLDGVSSELFWSAVADKPFPLVGAQEVYLAPGSEDHIRPSPGVLDVADHVIATGPMFQGLAENRLVVYRVGDGPLRNVTKSFTALARARWMPELARRVDVGQRLLSGQLGEGWYPIEGGYRWMGRTAIVRLPGPGSGNERLYVTGYASAETVSSGPVALSLYVDGAPFSNVEVSEPDARFDFSFPLPDALVGRPSVEVGLAVDRTFSPGGDPRQLGLAFGVISIR
jgi:hypothetical protein